MSMHHHKALGHHEPRHHMQTSQHPIPKLPESSSKEAVIYKTKRKKRHTSRTQRTGQRADAVVPCISGSLSFLASFICSISGIPWICVSDRLHNAKVAAQLLAFGIDRSWSLGVRRCSFLDVYVIDVRTPILLLLARTCLCKQSTSGDPTASVRVNLHNHDPPPARRLSRLARHSAVHRRTLRKQCRPGMHGPPRRSCVPISS
ncbi:hypothetical protein IWZ00DRAFT_53684 [Phyllosticta capitalensis]